MQNALQVFNEYTLKEQIQWASLLSLWNVCLFPFSH